MPVPVRARSAKQAFFFPQNPAGWYVTAITDDVQLSKGALELERCDGFETWQQVYLPRKIMADIIPQTHTMLVCFQSQYSLPYFQREYKWEPRHFNELLDDIQNSFLQNFDKSDGRQAVSKYTAYFLGSIITSGTDKGKKPVIDGQQRLTSIFILLCYLERYRTTHNIQNSTDLSRLLGNVNYGVTDYSIEFDTSRRQLFDKYLDRAVSTDIALQNAEQVQNLNDGDLKIIEALRNTETILSYETLNAIEYFIDYITQRVLLIEISVETESEAHRVFVTMNDRGLRLGPIDLLKGQILSKVTDSALAQECHTIWTDIIHNLKKFDPEEDSVFFKSLFRAKWALKARGKSKGDPAEDFDLIGDSYHRWFKDNADRLGLVNSDDYYNFVKVEIKNYADFYLKIKKAELNFDPNHPHTYYNSIRKLSSQPMIILSAIKADDSPAVMDQKLDLITKFLDLLLTSRIIEGKENNYDNLREPSFNYTKLFRNLEVAPLKATIKLEWSKYFPTISNLSGLKYIKADRSDLLFILSRIASYLEESLELKNKTTFPVYWQRDKGGRTFDIEHVFKSGFDPASLPTPHTFIDDKDYDAMRDYIGALILLPRSRNRSLQATPYKGKVAVYSNENVLASTLSASFYQNNPEAAKFLALHPALVLSAVPDFDKLHITERSNAYIYISQQIWKEPA